MTKSNLYSVLCTSVRLAAVYLFVEAASQVVSVIADGRTSISTQVWFWAIEMPTLQMSLALPLWLYPGVLARIAASKRSLEVFESDLSPATLQYLAFSILGVWFVVTGLSQFAYTIHRWLFLGFYVRNHLPDPTSDPKVLGSLLSELVRIGLGLALAFGARGLVALFKRFRQAGLPPAVEAVVPAAGEES